MIGYALFLFTTLTLADTAPFADENLRMSALHAIFPGMQISFLPGQRIDDSWPLEPTRNALNSPDALARENVYRVIGKATNEAEKEASDQLITGHPSNTRLVRFQIFPWPDGAGLLAVLQYKFDQAVPSMACSSIGLMVHLAKVAGSWRVRDRYLAETAHHFTLQTIRSVDLTGDGVDELVIESDFGGADTWGTNFMVFHLAAQIELIFETTSQISHGTDDLFTQVLDLPKTVEQEGKEVCFTKTTIFENGFVFDPPRISNVCYVPDEADNRKESEERGKLLVGIK